MKKIYLSTPQPTDITSFYRGLGPYAALRKDYSDEFTLTTHKETNTVELFDSDIVVMQRPFHPSARNLMDMAKSMGKKVIVDYDDDVLNVPEHNPHVNIYLNKDVIATIKYCLENADHVTVSTKQLMDRFITYNKNITVLPNAWDESFYPKTEINWAKREKSILWRGGESHVKDLESVKTDFARLTEINDNWTFYFLGGDTNHMKYGYLPSLNSTNTYSQKSVPMLEYVKSLSNIKPLIMTVPLVNDTFNQSKSNIAWIEGVVSGACCVAPDMPEWHKPGIINYTETNSFNNVVQGLIDNPISCRENWQKSMDYIEKNLKVEKINKERVKIIRELLK